MAKAATTKSFQIKLLVAKEPKLKYTAILNQNNKHSRSFIKIKESANQLTIEINADDSTALRASINSVLRDLQVIEATNIPSNKG
jgi:tRNA threonylcarbamoyladenosine modification (KEOPS) complex  Pcc1 subunit